MLLYNATNEEQSVKAFGNWFSFKPKQIKSINDQFGRFIVMDKKEYGIVDLPEEMLDEEYKKSEAGQALLREKTEQGIQQRVNFLKLMVYNAEVSLRRDLDRNNDKSDHRAQMTKGEIEAMRRLVEYQKADEDQIKAQVDEIKDLEKKLKK